MQGRRIYLDSDGDEYTDAALTVPTKTRPGDYWKHLDGGFGWSGVCPNGCPCNVSGHQVVEHEDATITVSPSIKTGSTGKPEWDWHGYLERGTWRGCGD